MKIKIEISSCKNYEGKLKPQDTNHSTRQGVFSKRFERTVEVLIQVSDLDDYGSLAINKSSWTPLYFGWPSIMQMHMQVSKVTQIGNA